MSARQNTTALVEASPSGVCAMLHAITSCVAAVRQPTPSVGSGDRNRGVVCQPQPTASGRASDGKRDDRRRSSGVPSRRSPARTGVLATRSSEVTACFTVLASLRARPPRRQQCRGGDRGCRRPHTHARYELVRVYGDEKVANRDIKVWHGATGKGP
jgi:hypothetical protein